MIELKNKFMSRIWRSDERQKGFGGILILVVVVFIFIVVGVMIYFLVKGNKAETTPLTESSKKTGSAIKDEEVLWPVCETGDTGDCNDPISTSAVESVKVDDLP